MLNEDNITSDYGDIKESDSGSINFSRATKLERSGSTCDAYITRIQNKTLFVKRLKAELRTSPRVRVAFQKEYELGINLVHPALPVYRSHGDDYIVMDYVDGTTLADMIANHDQWLMNPENIRGMLRQLVDVVGYMHRKNVLHSDIKPDNVMITYGTRNTMLIDLDKAYTFTHNDTAGAPGKYGLEGDDHGNPAIDYNGIAGIVDSLTAAGFPTMSFRRFLRLCKKPGITSDKLLKTLEQRRLTRLIIFMVALLLVAGVIAVVLLSRHDNTTVMPTEVNVVSATTDSISAPADDISETKTDVIELPAVKQENYESIINREMEGYFKSVEDKIHEVEALLASGTATYSELLDAQYAITEVGSIALQTAYKMYEARFSDIPSGKVDLAVATCAPTSKILKRQSEISERILLEIMLQRPETYNTPEDSVMMLELMQKYK